MVATLFKIALTSLRARLSLAVQAAPQSKQTARPSKASTVAAFKECERSGCNGTWILNGQRVSSNWTGGVQHIVVRRQHIFMGILSFFALMILASFGAHLHAQIYNAADDPKWLSYTRLIECESWTRCGGHWAFQNSRSGGATWDGEYPLTAKLHIREITDKTVVIDRTGPAAGFTSVYRGTLTGNVIQGDVTWTWPGHFPAPVHGHWLASTNGGSLQAVIAAHFPQQPANIAGTWLANQSLTECESATSCDGLWEFDNSINAKAYWTAGSAEAFLKVTKLTTSTIEITRWNELFPRVAAVYTGTLKDGIVEGDVTWTFLDQNSRQAHGHWYASVSREALRARLNTRITAPPPPPPPVPLAPLSLSHPASASNRGQGVAAP